jgi:uncharacterized membrane protein YsdA (DUF1294 family)
VAHLRAAFAILANAVFAIRATAAFAVIVIARSGATRQSRRIHGSGLLRLSARNDGVRGCAVAHLRAAFAILANAVFAAFAILANAVFPTFVIATAAFPAFVIATAAFAVIVIARSGATRQSRRIHGSGLLRLSARNDGVDGCAVAHLHNAFAICATATFAILVIAITRSATFPAFAIARNATFAVIVIARSEATRQSRRIHGSGLLRLSARNDDG